MYNFDRESQSKIVNMTPDKTVQWQAFELEDVESTLYVAPDCPHQLSEIAVRLSVEKTRPAESTVIGAGQYAVVHDIGDGMVAKVSSRKPYTNGPNDYQLLAGGLPDLKANVSLQHGLEVIDQPVHRFRTEYSFHAPKVHAACISDVNSADNVWIMDEAPGIHPTGRFELPSERTRRRVYDEALRACGLSPHQIYYDDAAENMLVSEESTRHVAIAKFDVIAKYPLVY